MPRLRYQGREFDLNPGETVLEALERAGLSPEYSCRIGTCETCMLRCLEGEVGDAQASLRPAWVELGYFLPCLCRPDGDLDIVEIAPGEIFQACRLEAREVLAPHVLALRLRPAESLSYRPGQFINLRRADGLVRSYSLASLPGAGDLEIHVQRMDNGRMSNWLWDEASPGMDLAFCGPLGECYYQGKAEEPLLLIATGTGLAPLWGILQEALAAGHRGSIHLYHGSRRPQGLYRHAALNALTANHGNLHYQGCVSGDCPEGYRAGRADALAFADHADLNGWRVYLCGHPVMVRSAQRRAYLAGAALHAIHSDPFDFRDLRSETRS